MFAGRAGPDWTPHRSPALRRSVTDSTLTVKMLGMFLVNRGWLRVLAVASAKTATPTVFYPRWPLHKIRMLHEPYVGPPYHRRPPSTVLLPRRAPLERAGVMTPTIPGPLRGQPSASSNQACCRGRPGRLWESDPTQDVPRCPRARLNRTRHRCPPLRFIIRQLPSFSILRFLPAALTAGSVIQVRRGSLRSLSTSVTLIGAFLL